MRVLAESSIPSSWAVRANVGSAPRDCFHELIFWDEQARACEYEVTGQLKINTMAVPPVWNFGSKKHHALLYDVVAGKKNICLAISEPSVGSDVASLKTCALKVDDHYIVNGQKKWISGGTYADYFTLAVRSGGPGAGGISLLLVDANSPGITVRPLKTQFDTCHGTTMVLFENVQVPADRLIGEENQGFMYLVRRLETFLGCT